MYEQTGLERTYQGRQIMADRFDVIVVGGGHAGCEAAAAAARMGASVGLITMRADRIGEMSCNPAIGGLGKGHLVREIDALDGIMGRAIDRAGIQFRMLNKSRGPAVHGPRAQADRALYRTAIQNFLAEYDNIQVIESAVGDVAVEKTQHGKQVKGIITEDGYSYDCTYNCTDDWDIPWRAYSPRGRAHTGRPGW